MDILKILSKENIYIYIKLDRKKIYTKFTMDIFKVPIFGIFNIQIKYNYNKNNFKKIYNLILYFLKKKKKNKK